MKRWVMAAAVAAVLLWVVGGSLSLLFDRFGTVRVLGQVARYAVAPALRSALDSDKKKVLMPRAQVRREKAKEKPRKKTHSLAFRQVTEVSIFAISLARRTDRADWIKQQLRGCTYQLFPGIDGEHADLEPDAVDLELFFGGKRLRESGLDSGDCQRARSGCRKGSSMLERRKIALDLTYIRLLRQIAQLSHPAVVFEDDAWPIGEMTNARLVSEMSQLPADWDLFMLHSFEPIEAGPFVADRVRVLRSGVGTVAFAITPENARRIVRLAQRAMPEMYIDLMVMGLMAESNLANTYIAQPFLVQHAPNFTSTFG